MSSPWSFWTSAHTGELISTAPLQSLFTARHSAYPESSYNHATHVLSYQTYRFLRHLQQTMRSIQPTQPRFQRPYDGQYRVVSKSDKYFTLHVKGRTETVSIDRLKTASVTQFGNSEEDTPVICPAEPSPTTILGLGPSLVLPVPSSSALQSDDRPGTVSTTRSDRIQRRPLHFS